MVARAQQDALSTALQPSSVERAFTFYYDQTHNTQQLGLPLHNFSVRPPTCFVLGGIAHSGSPRPFDMNALPAQCGLQKTTNEVEGGAHGFLALLAAPPVGALLEWVMAEGLHVHYQAIDLLYNALAGTVDSILVEAQARALQAIAPLIKDSLYSVLKLDRGAAYSLLFRYNYPRVGSARRPGFLAELLALIAHRAELLDHFSRQVLTGVLELGAQLYALPYLDDKSPCMLSEGFAGFWRHRIITFADATHILENPEQVYNVAGLGQPAGQGEPLTNVCAPDHQTSPCVQLSGQIMVLLSQLFTYVNQTSSRSITRDRAALSDVQTRNLASLANLLIRSKNFDAVFAQHMLSASDLQNVTRLLSPQTQAAAVQRG